MKKCASFEEFVENAKEHGSKVGTFSMHGFTEDYSSGEKKISNFKAYAGIKTLDDNGAEYMELIYSDPQGRIMSNDDADRIRKIACEPVYAKWRKALEEKGIELEDSCPIR